MPDGRGSVSEAKSYLGCAGGVLVLIVGGASFYGGLLISPWLFVPYGVLAAGALGLALYGRVRR
jgi:hypothetical protein